MNFSQSLNIKSVEMHHHSSFDSAGIDSSIDFDEDTNSNLIVVTPRFNAEKRFIRRNQR